MRKGPTGVHELEGPEARPEAGMLECQPPPVRQAHSWLGQKGAGV